LFFLKKRKERRKLTNRNSKVFQSEKGYLNLPLYKK